ncbi:hypothetical protein GCK72_014409 [Caenorhabditis remanei]|uniref:Uncharacterized protein n=1 Tax=Caenorhabditis remanei TaxID=31234 RepID=E3MLZ1_CAERE|nr:hypothetical protein GCK72_014409 [Caenorhabditis remanei]EFP04812.1 hypothetical protein CRE_29972 [Caenorhabditis remanei]KAF1757951.1 hypothetical protein GCK72_014409 [Caenorhabditis remanei]
MDVDLASVEVVFAQKLACGEPATRQRALRVLHDWIRDQSARKPFDEADLMRLCKGLHYVLWMQDKMILQEELADRIAGLITIFTSEQEKLRYVSCFLKSLSNEWPHIDRWRMDKFLMAVRRMVRSCFAHLASLKWKKEVRDEYWNVFRKTTISADKSFNEGLKFHFCSILLDELDKAGSLTKKQVTACLKPYIELLGDKNISEYLFKSIHDEIFKAILQEKSDSVQAAVYSSEENDEAGIEFSYNEIATLLFEEGKKENLNAKRRKTIYALVEKFKKCARGQDPHHFEAPIPKEKLTKKDYEEAEKRAVELAESFKQDKKNARKLKSQIKKRAREASESARTETGNADVPEDEITEVRKGSGKKTAVPKVKKGKPLMKAKGVGKKQMLGQKKKKNGGKKN